MSDDILKILFSPETIRERSQKILALSIEGKGHFEVHLDELDNVVKYVVEVIKSKYPDMNIPYHSRWGHFQVGGVDRLKVLNDKISDYNEIEKAKTKFDLVMTSVLLDAGAGPQWKYNDPVSGGFYSRSEGLAVASFNLFMEGAFSSDKELPLQADGPGLLHFTEERLKKSFQVSVGNPLTGTKGRTELIHEMGRVVENIDVYFYGHWNRPGGLIDYFLKERPNKKIEAAFILKTLLYALGPIWPGRQKWEGQSLGDVWHYSPLGEKSNQDAYVPFHKLSQWLSYSLIEPLEDLGFKVIGLDELTGLAEYRNGGLMIDSGLISFKDKREAEMGHHPDSQVIIEWRALTICLLDQIAEKVREELGLSQEDFPLVKVLEGGTWWAGRKIAKEKRKDGASPIQLISDGTVF